MPVFNTAERRDDLLTVPTRALFYLRQEAGKDWVMGGWRCTSGPRTTPGSR